MEGDNRCIVACICKDMAPIYMVKKRRKQLKPNIMVLCENLTVSQPSKHVSFQRMYRFYVCFKLHCGHSHATALTTDFYVSYQAKHFMYCSYIMYNKDVADDSEDTQ